MADLKQYLDIMTDTLMQKKEVLEEILAKNRLQEQALRDNGDIDSFDELVRDKGLLIQRMESLDYGFDRIYERAGEELAANKDLYKTEIGTLQSLITQITELSVAIEASEQRNKGLVDSYFHYARGRIRQAKKSVRAANDYYKTMSNSAAAGAMMMDKKK